MSQERELAQFVAAAIKTTMAPLQAELKALQALQAALDARMQENGALRERVAVLEVLKPIPGPAGPQGERGEHGKDGEDGEDGLNGKDGTAGLNGKDGEDGLHGKDGAPGRDGLDGKDGAAGLHGKDGLPGDRGERGADGLQGKDGIVDPLFVQACVAKELAAWPHPKDGQDGKDGFSLLDFEATFEPETRNLHLRFQRDGMPAVGRDIPLTGLRMYRGTWEAGKSYAHGDVVTWNGSEWTAMAATSDRPGNGVTDWKLTVKHGEKGERGPDGKPGRDGKDLTQMDATGRKW